MVSFWATPALVVVKNTCLKKLRCSNFQKNIFGAYEHVSFSRVLKLLFILDSELYTCLSLVYNELVKFVSRVPVLTIFLFSCKSSYCHEALIEGVLLVFKLSSMLYWAKDPSNMYLEVKHLKHHYGGEIVEEVHLDAKL